MNIIQVKGNVDWRAQRDPVTGWWVAECPALKLCTTAETWRELHENSVEAIDLLMQEMLTTGDLNKFLKDHGWQLKTKIPLKPQRLRFDVPFRMTPRNERHSPQAALC